MSSSNPQNTKNKAGGKEIGTIFMGPAESRESSLEKLLGNGQTQLWTKNTEEEYMNRVKEKALVKVKSLLVKAEEKSQTIISEAELKVQEINAQVQADKVQASQNLLDSENTLAEAENIKMQAHEEGFNAGLHQAQEQLALAKNELSQAVAFVLLSIHEQCITIFNSWRKDLSELLLEAVEKSTAYILDTDKTAMLQALLEQSVNALLDKREYQIRVNPNDAMIMTELLEIMHKDIAHSRRWNLASDESLQEGSIVVESPSGLVKNSMTARESFVSDILAQLTLPLSQGDQVAYDAVTQNLINEAQKANIPLGNEESAEQSQTQNDDFSAPSDSSPQENFLADEEVHTAEMSSMEEISQDPIPEQQQEVLQSAEQQAHVEPVLQEPLPTQQAIAPDKDEALAQQAAQMVEDELNFDNEIFENASDESQKFEEISPPSETVQNPNDEEKKQSSEQYTPELADELLSEMGF